MGFGDDPGSSSADAAKGAALVNTLLQHFAKIGNSVHAQIGRKYQETPGPGNKGSYYRSTIATIARLHGHVPSRMSNWRDRPDIFNPETGATYEIKSWDTYV